MSQELVTYIVLGSKSRLQGIKLPANSKFEEYTSLNFDSKHKILEKLDQLITASQGELIVLLPPSSYPNSYLDKMREAIELLIHLGKQ